MLDKGLTEDGAAQALGRPKARVTARVKLLELPDRARELVGAGVVPLSAVDQLRAIGSFTQQLLEGLVDYIADHQGGDTWAASQLVSDPGYVLGNALRETDSKVFAAYLHQLDPREVEELRLGKKAAEQLAEAEKLHRQINQYAYGPPTIRFNEQDVDEARAAGVLLELDRCTPIIVDRPLYRELAKRAIKRAAEELQERAEHTKTERKQTAKERSAQPADPVEGARREHRRRVREVAGQAHGANLDVSWSLINNLAVVDPGDITVARFFVYGLLGSDYDGSPTHAVRRPGRRARCAGHPSRNRGVPRRRDQDAQERVARQAADRLRRSEPAREADRVAVEVHRRCQDCQPAVWPGTGRNRRRATRLPARCARKPAVAAKRWPSHKDHAAEALAKVAGPHLPATLKQLEKAIAKASTELQEAQERAYAESRERAVAARKAARPARIPAPAPSRRQLSRPRVPTSLPTSSSGTKIWLTPRARSYLTATST